MANEKNRAIYKTEDVELVDGTVITLKSLPIKPLREFMNIWENIDYDESNQVEIFDSMFEAAAVGILWHNKDLTKEQLEESLDQDTMRRAIEICTGIKMMDPEEIQNLMAEQMKSETR